MLGTMVWSPVGMPASQIEILDWGPGYCFLIQLPVDACPGNLQMVAQVLGLCQLHGRCRLRSGILGLAWSIPGACGRAVKQQMEAISVSFMPLK